MQWIKKKRANRVQDKVARFGHRSTSALPCTVVLRFCFSGTSIKSIFTAPVICSVPCLASAECHRTEMLRGIVFTRTSATRPPSAKSTLHINHVPFVLHLQWILYLHSLQKTRSDTRLGRVWCSILVLVVSSRSKKKGGVPSSPQQDGMNLVQKLPS